MIEYEYSFRVTDIEKYLNYIYENEYKKTYENSQIRKLYTSKNKILARLTTNIIDGKTETFLDFKDENNKDEILKLSRETVPLKVTDEIEESVDSILNIFEYTLSKTLKRDRMIFEKGQVKFEIDHYHEPEDCYVVAIEGEKGEVDRVYNEITNMK